MGAAASFESEAAALAAGHSADEVAEWQGAHGGGVAGAADNGGADAAAAAEAAGPATDEGDDAAGGGGGAEVVGEADGSREPSPLELMVASLDDADVLSDEVVGGSTALSRLLLSPSFASFFVSSRCIAPGRPHVRLL